MSARISFSFPEYLQEELKALAKNERRSLSAMCQIILSDGLESRRSKKVENKRVVLRKSN
jgi:hypothetical protein